MLVDDLDDEPANLAMRQALLPVGSLRSAEDTRGAGPSALGLDERNSWWTPIRRAKSCPGRSSATPMTRSFRGRDGKLGDADLRE